MICACTSVTVYLRPTMNKICMENDNRLEVNKKQRCHKIHRAESHVCAWKWDWTVYFFVSKSYFIFLFRKESFLLLLFTIWFDQYCVFHNISTKQVKEQRNRRLRNIRRRNEPNWASLWCTVNEQKSIVFK